MSVYLVMSRQERSQEKQLGESCECSTGDKPAGAQPGDAVGRKL